MNPLDTALCTLCCP